MNLVMNVILSALPSPGTPLHATIQCVIHWCQMLLVRWKADLGSCWIRRWIHAYTRHMDKQKRTHLSGCCGKFRWWSVQWSHIFYKYEGVLQHWNLQRHIVRVVTDSASNMIKAFNLPGFDESAGEEEGEEEVLEEGDTEDGQPFPLGHIYHQNNLHMRCPIHLQQLALKKR